MSDSLLPHGLQHARLLCPLLSPRVCSNSRLLNQWCYLTISSSVALFSPSPQSFPTSGSFPMSQFFTSGGQSIGVSVLASVLPMNNQGWFPLGLTGLISLQSKGLLSLLQHRNSNASIFCREQDGGGVGGRGVHLSPWIHQECTFRHRSACRAPAKSGQEYLTSGKEYMLCYAKSLQSCPTLCDPIDSSPPGSTVPGILQAKILEWVAISFSNAWKRKVKVKSLSRVRLLATPWTAAHQAPLSMDFPGRSTGVGCHCLLRKNI